MKIVIGYAAIVVLALFMVTELVTPLRPAVEAPVATVNKLLAGDK